MNVKLYKFPIIIIRPIGVQVQFRIHAYQKSKIK